MKDQDGLRFRWMVESGANVSVSDDGALGKTACVSRKKVKNVYAGGETPLLAIRAAIDKAMTAEVSHPTKED